MIGKPCSWLAYISSVLFQGIDGGFVGLSKRSSRLNKEEFSQLIEVIYAFGAERNVAWAEPVITNYDKYKEAA